MERLTYRDKDGQVKLKSYNGVIFDAYDRLAAYEDADEQGLLVRPVEWISVKDKLPEADCKVLAYYGFDHGAWDLGMMFYGVLDYYAFDEKPHFQHASTGLTVTHWMPLPEPPNCGADMREVDNAK